MKIKLLLSILFSILFLAACGSNPESQATTNENTSIEKEAIHTTIIGGRTGGAWSVFTEGVAESIRREYDDAIVTVEPGSLIENPIMVGKGSVPYGMSYAMTAYSAYIGEEPFDTAYEDLRAVSVVIPANYYQFLVRSELDFSNLKEIIDSQYPLRLAVDQQGAAGEIITREILNFYDVTYEDISSWGGSVDYLSGTQAFDMMSDQRIDATGDAESAPSSNILEASTMSDLQMLELDEEVIAAVSTELGMDANQISQDTYEFLENDVPTVSTPAILITHKDTPLEEVYAITESIYQNFDYLRTVHEEFKDLSEENIMRVGEVPLHPGAEKFYKEIGLSQ